MLDFINFGFNGVQHTYLHFKLKELLTSIISPILYLSDIINIIIIITPGVHHVQNFWYKKITSSHEKLADLLNKLLQKPQGTPYFLTMDKIKHSEQY